MPELNDLIKKEGSVAANEKGEILEKKGMESGEEREAVIIHIESEEDVKNVTKNVTETYELFAELGFKIYKKNVGNETNIAAIFGIEMPRGYFYNPDPLTMNDAQVELATELLIAQRSKEEEMKKNGESLPLQNGTIFTEIFGSLKIEDLAAALDLAKKDFEWKLTDEKLGEVTTAVTPTKNSERISNSSTVFIAPATKQVGQV